MRKIIASWLVVAAGSVALAAGNTGDAAYPWSVEVNGIVSRETQHPPKAWLWLPPKSRRVSAVVVGMHNMLEEPIFEHPLFRAALAKANVGICWVTPMIPQQWDKLTEDEVVAIETVFSDFAKLTKHPELKTVPLAPFGHSAMATYPYHFAAMRPKRTLCAVSIKGDWPTKGRPCWESACAAGRLHVPMLLISGEYEDGYHRRELARDLMKEVPDATFSMWVDVGGGHFDWSDELCRDLGAYFAAMVKGGVAKGKRAVMRNGFWWPNEAVANMIAAYEALPRGKGEFTTLGYVVRGEKVKQNPKAHTQVIFHADGKEFEIVPCFEDVVPPGRPETWTGRKAGEENPHPADPNEVKRIVVQRIDGPVEHVEGNKWRVTKCRYDPAGRRVKSATLQMVYPGGNGFKRSVQQAEVKVKYED